MTEPRTMTPDEIRERNARQMVEAHFAHIAKAEAWQREIQFRIKAAIWIVAGCLIVAVSAWLSVRGIG